MAAVVFGTLDGEHDEHATGDGHPERHARLRAVTAGITDHHLGEFLVPLEHVEPASDKELERVHTRSYIAGLRAVCEAGGGELDPDTPVGPKSADTAARGAGLGLAALRELQAGKGDAAFVAPRPPGHHATSTRGMGFCLFNNVAVTASALVDGGERVLIVDFDVHHGNGTQAIYWNDPNVMYVSTHEWPAYPGTGAASEIGGPAAPGLTVNVPLPSGATGDLARRAFDDIVAPEVSAFAPTWVLLSAGFDAHRDDPMADLAWSAGDFYDLTRVVMDYAPAPGRVIAFLEGGYDLRALAHSSAACIAALASHPLVPEPRTAGGPGADAVAAVPLARARQLEALA